MASIALCMLRSNILAAVKRFKYYENFGELFKESQKNALKLSVMDRIWLIITDLVMSLSAQLEIDAEKLIQIIVTDNESFKKYIHFKACHLWLSETCES